MQVCMCSPLCALQQQQVLGCLEVDRSLPQCTGQVHSISRQHSCSTRMSGVHWTLPGRVRGHCGAARQGRAQLQPSLCLMS